MKNTERLPDLRVGTICERKKLFLIPLKAKQPNLPPNVETRTLSLSVMRKSRCRGLGAVQLITLGTSAGANACALGGNLYEPKQQKENDMSNDRVKLAEALNTAKKRWRNMMPRYSYYEQPTHPWMVYFSPVMTKLISELIQFRVLARGNSYCCG